MARLASAYNVEQRRLLHIVGVLLGICVTLVCGSIRFATIKWGVSGTYGWGAESRYSVFNFLPMLSFGLMLIAALSLWMLVQWLRGLRE